MKKGQVVKCIYAGEPEFTVGQLYTLTAGEGDTDKFGCVMDSREMMLIDDDGDERYDVYPSSALNEWELVTE